jgi:hypothetical protein
MREHIQSLCGKIWDNGDCVLTLIELAERITQSKRDVLETIITLIDKNYIDKNLNPQKGLDEIINFLTDRQFTHKREESLEEGEGAYVIEVWGIDESHIYCRLRDWDCLKSCKYVNKGKGKGKLLFYHIFRS